MRIPVLMYHRVGPSANAWEHRYSISAEGFADHVRALARAGYCGITIDALVDWLEQGRPLPEGALLITFDDGFRGVFEHAYPVLREAGWSATIFLVSTLIGGQDEWCRKSNPSGCTYPLMDAAEIAAMAADGFSFHSHTRSHPSLPTLGDDALADELSLSRTEIAAVTGRDVDFFAYPFGHLDQRVCEAVAKAGYRAAFSTQPGFNRRDVDPYRIRRIEVFGTDSAAALLRKIRFGTNDGSVGQVARYYAERILQGLGVRS